MKILLLFIVPLSVFGQGFLLQENKGQFPEQVIFKAKLNYGALFVEENKLTFVLHQKDQLEELYESMHHPDKKLLDNKFDSHSFSIEFLNANKSSEHKGDIKAKHYYNYYQGNDPDKWASKVKAYQELWINNIYPNIDFHLFGKGNSIKYEFIIKPGGNPNLIQMKYSDANLTLHNNQIAIKTSVGNLIDERPLSFYKSNEQSTISTFYQLNNNIVSFKLGDYDKSKTFVLDPDIRFASFTGSTVDNFGFTASYDQSKNAYTAGIAFGTGYPITPGAFESNFGGPGTKYGCDISISKFNTIGTDLVYSTYLGGTGIDCPHSLVVNENDELIVFGTTSSPNFPVIADAYDTSYAGGVFAVVDYVLSFTGSDIIISKFNADGTSLEGSTFYGGSGNDGFNDEYMTTGLHHNYSDCFRGEVITDAAGGIYIATTTSSQDIPIVNGFQNTFGGGTHDGVVLKFDSDLKNLSWSSYLGGSSDDAVYAIQPHSNGDIYVTGGTLSNDFPITVGSHLDTHQGGIDGFVARLSPNGGAILNSSFIGSSDYDQSFFVQVDQWDKVYVYGQTEGDIPVVGEVYSNPNSGQFIQKYSDDLTQLELSTVVGSGTGKTEIVPSAFLVNHCGQIYISGWGGKSNSFNSGGNTFGFPTTSDAFQNTTDGSDFYLMLLDIDMKDIMYGTFFGGNGVGEHVDGGTSRFDKNGVVYQAVCAGCGASSAFPVTPGVWSETNNSDNCNLGVFKMDISKLTSVIATKTSTQVCALDTMFFYNKSNGGTEYEWIFHDGVRSYEKDTWRIFSDTGTFEVTLISKDPSGCPAADTTFTEFRVLALPDIDVQVNNIDLCNGDSLELQASGSEQFKWFTTTGTSIIDSTGGITVAPEENLTYYVTSYNSLCKSDTEFVLIDVFYPPEDTSFNFTKCDYENATLPFQAQEDYSYSWVPTNNIIIEGDQVSFNPDTFTIYELTIQGKCGSAKINYSIDVINIEAEAGPDTITCPSDSVRLFASGGSNYSWSPNKNITDSLNQFPTASPDSSINYIVTISEGKCSKTDTAKIIVYEQPHQPVDGEYTIQYGESQFLELDPGFSYEWTPRDFLDCNNCYGVTSTPEEDIMYYFKYRDENSCYRTDSIQINVIFNLWVANTFTPNGDGKNDVFYAFSHLVKDFHMDIFDRWGEKVFESDNINEGWDGTVNGRLAQIDVYVYKITYTKIHTNKPIQLVDHVNLIR